MCVVNEDLIASHYPPPLPHFKRKCPTPDKASQRQDLKWDTKFTIQIFTNQTLTKYKPLSRTSRTFSNPCIDILHLHYFINKIVKNPLNSKVCDIGRDKSLPSDTKLSSPRITK